MERVIITQPMIGLTAMQACCVADATDKEILKVCNAKNPAGTTNGWCKVHRTDDEAPAPVKCEEHPNRIHFIITC